MSGRRPAFIAFLLLACGIYSGSRFPLPFIPAYGINVLLLIALFLPHCRLNRNARQYSLFFLIIFTGICLHSFHTKLYSQNDLRNIPEFETPVIIHGSLIKDPVKNTQGSELLLSLTHLYTESQIIPAKGKMLLFTQHPGTDTLFYANNIIFKANFIKPSGKSNPGGFDYSSYLSRRGIHRIAYHHKHTPVIRLDSCHGNILLKKLVYPLRRKMKKIIRASSSTQSADLLFALLLGEKKIISDEIQQDFAVSGLSHLLAVSGLHTGFVLLILQFFLSVFRPHPFIKWIFISAGLLLFTLLTQGNTPVLRASLMASLLILGRSLERKIDSLNLIGVAGCIILVMNPLQLFDLGFCLSFSAVLSIIVLYPKMKTQKPVSSVYNRFKHNKIIRFCMDAVLVSLSAQTGTFLFTVNTFNRFSLIAPILNIIAVPWTGIIVAIGFITVIFAPFSLWISYIYAFSNDFLIRLFLQWTKISASLPFANLYIPSLSVTQNACFILIVLLFFFNPFKKSKISIILILIILNVLTWRPLFKTLTPKMRYVQLDAGQGDAAVFHLPQNRTVLIDGGSRTQTRDTGERVLLPYLRHRGVKKIDFLLLTHSHNDHLGGFISLLESIPVKHILLSDSANQNHLFRTFLNSANQKNIPITICKPGDALIFKEAEFQFLAPPARWTNTAHISANHLSLVCRVEMQGKSILMMGDAEKETEIFLINSHSLIRSDILKAGHHGSSTSSLPEFIQNVRADDAVISVGRNNRFNHPSSSVITLYHARGMNIHRTDHEGAVVFEIQSGKIKKINWRKEILFF